MMTGTPEQYFKMIGVDKERTMVTNLATREACLFVLDGYKIWHIGERDCQFYLMKHSNNSIR